MNTSIFEEVRPRKVTIKLFFLDLTKFLIILPLIVVVLGVLSVVLLLAVIPLIFTFILWQIEKKRRPLTENQSFL